MKGFHYRKQPFFRLCLFCLAAILGIAASVRSADPPVKKAPSLESRPNEPIHITADRLVTDIQQKSAEFTGNVKAIQGETVITSDGLKVFYKQLAEKSENPLSGQESIEKIVAYGNVAIHFENKLAVSQQAVYITDQRILILTGPESRVTSGANFVAGEKITLYRDDGQVVVERGNEKQVEAVIFQGEKGIE